MIEESKNKYPFRMCQADASVAAVGGVRDGNAKIKMQTDIKIKKKSKQKDEKCESEKRAMQLTCDCQTVSIRIVGKQQTAAWSKACEICIIIHVSLQIHLVWWLKKVVQKLQPILTD